MTKQNLRCDILVIDRIFRLGIVRYSFTKPIRVDR